MSTWEGAADMLWGKAYVFLMTLTSWRKMSNEVQ